MIILLIKNNLLVRQHVCGNQAALMIFAFDETSTSANEGAFSMMRPR